MCHRSQATSEKYTILSKTWSIDQLIIEPVTPDNGENTCCRDSNTCAGVDDTNQADFSTMSVLSFLAASIDEEDDRNTSTTKTVA